VVADIQVSERRLDDRAPTEDAALAIARGMANGRTTVSEAAAQFHVSTQMIQWRLNITGATKRVERARTAGYRRN
jgi:hypothetical protein